MDKCKANERDMLIFQIGNQEEFGYWYPNQMNELGKKYGFTEKEMLELIRDIDVKFGKLEKTD